MLADRGHKVVRWRSAFSHQSKTFLTDGNASQPHDNYTQNFIAGPAYRRHAGPARIRNHRALGRNFLKMARSGPAPDLIHVGNVPIALTHAVVRYGREVGCPVVVDVRDLWPDAYAEFLPARLRGFRGPLIKALHATSLRLKWAMANATAVTALTQPYMDWAMRLAGRKQRDTDAIFGMCYPQRTDVPPDTDLDALRARLGLAKGDQIAVYLGNIGYQSDFDTVIAAARKVLDTHPNFKVVLAGSGPLEEPLRQATKDLPNVIVPGWLEGPEIAAMLHLGDIGLIAFHPVPNYLLNIPNKFSEYLAGGLAIACGLGGEMGRLTQETGSGFLYPPGDAEALAAALAKALNDSAALQHMAARARALHSERFDGAQIYPRFADHLERLAEPSLQTTSE